MSRTSECERPIAVLIVDDDAAVRSLARRDLSKHGFAVSVVETGEEALEAYAARWPDVILLDIHLPDIDGFEVSRRLHELYGDQTAPILMLMGADDRHAFVKGYQAGATDLLLKPLEREALIHRLQYFVRAHRDRLELKRSEAMLRRAQRVVRMGSWEYDTESKQLTRSEEAKRIFGLRPDQSDAVSETDRASIFPADRERVLRAVRESLDLRKSFSIEHRILLEDGDVRHVRQLAEPLDTLDQEGTLWIGTIQDITHQAEALQRVRFLANYDRLTGLSNRSLFKRQVSESVECARLQDRQVGVVFLDIDRFKRINNSLGPSAGDQLLRTIVHRIQEVVRSSDRLGRTDSNEKRSMMGRSGGDEFMLLFPKINRPEDASLVANRILAVLREPFEIDDKNVTVTCSIGLAIYPDDGLDVETLMRNAETSMYCAKGCGGNCIQLFGDSKTTALVRRIAMEGQLRAALERQEFELHYQPKIELATGAVVGFEALLRWRSPELGLVSPSEFIPVAEEAGLIKSIGQWVIEAACRTSKQWQRAGLRRVPIAVNVSTHQFVTENLHELVSSILAKHKLEPHWLEIEITESAIMQDDEGAAATMRQLQKDGLRIALDDFGTGYSSLSYLKRFPLDTLKIDSSFVIDLPEDLDAAGIVQAIIAMAKVLDLTVIAEGVETEAQRSFLTSLGCDQMQGFLVSPAQAEEDAIRFLEPGLSVFEQKDCDTDGCDSFESGSEIRAAQG